MSWILLLIQLLPTVISVVQMIIEWIGKLPSTERRAVRAEFYELVKRNVIRARDPGHPKAILGRRAGRTYALSNDAKSVRAELDKFLERVKARAVVFPLNKEHKVVTKKADLLAVLEWLYENEINCEISSFWDAGWSFSLGDKVNGFIYSDGDFRDLGEAAAALAKAAFEAYPTLRETTPSLARLLGL